MQFAHPGKNGLPGIGVRIHAQRWIFLNQLLNRQPQLFLVGLGLRLDGKLDHRLGEVDGFEQDGMLLIAHGVAGDYVLQAHRGADIARQHFLDLFALVGVHLHQTPHAFLAVLGDVEDELARAQLARVHANERELPDKGIGHDLKDQRGERRVVFGRTRFGNVRMANLGALNRLYIHRRRQVIHHGVEQVLNALVLKRGSADHREDLLRDGRLADPAHDLFLGNRRAFDELLEQVVVGFGYRFDHLFAVCLGLVHEIGWNLNFVVFGAQGFIAPYNGFQTDQIHHALELIFRADGDLDGHRAAAHAFHDGVDGVVKVRAHAVHLVNEANPGYAVLIGLPPHGFRLRLDARHRVEHGHGAVQNAQAALYFRCEIDVPGGIDDVDG